MKKFKTGFVSIIGRPNVGKSTLLNNLLKTKVSIVTDKPQTTRDRISGVFNSDMGQIIFLDTPGYHKESNKMNNFMNNVIFLSAKNSDLILLTVPCDEFIGSNDKKIIEFIKKWNIPTILLITKIDKISSSEIDLKEKEWIGLFDGFIDVVRISALNNINIELLINVLYKHLPYSDIKYYPEDQITDKSDAFLIKEFVREEILLQTEQEVPHASAIMIEKIVEQNEVLKVYIVIYVERDTQKAIIIGKNGAKIKSIGIAARKKIEEYLNRKVYLETYVKVKNDWTKSGSMLKRLGYDIDEY